MKKTEYPEAAEIAGILKNAKSVVILQADNPDGDSLASALALEQILSDMDKEPFLYCGIDIPSYLHHLSGWSRVSKDIPHKFDASIIVDTSSDDLFESLKKTNLRKSIANKPCIVLDHHPVEAGIPFATVTCNKNVVATGELIYELAHQLNWPISLAAKELIATSIMSDSLGLVSEGTSSRSIQVISELVENGVSLAKAEAARRELMRKSPELTRYKGQLLQRIEYYDRIATITIPWEEIHKYSPLYNPSMLVIDDMRLTEGVDVAIAFKVYRDGKITGKIRTNFNKGIANDLAFNFGGGGHRYASGFKINDGQLIKDVINESVKIANQLLDKLDQDNKDAVV
ncbi:MAG: DHH family phosphoesterase [Candidatus Saccharibacteria bacterium]